MPTRQPKRCSMRAHRVARGCCHLWGWCTCRVQPCLYSSHTVLLSACCTSAQDQLAFMHAPWDRRCCKLWSLTGLGCPQAQSCMSARDPKNYHTSQSRSIHGTGRESQLHLRIHRVWAYGRASQCQEQLGPDVPSIQSSSQAQSHSEL